MIREIPDVIDDFVNVNLAPCPFCGKDIAKFSNCQEMELCKEFETCLYESHYFCVVCSMADHGCGCSSGFYPTGREAADAWNRREGCIGMDDAKKALYASSVGGGWDKEGFIE